MLFALFVFVVVVLGKHVEFRNVMGAIANPHNCASWKHALRHCKWRHPQNSSGMQQLFAAALWCVLLCWVCCVGSVVDAMERLGGGAS